MDTNPHISCCKRYPLNTTYKSKYCNINHTEIHITNTYLIHYPHSNHQDIKLHMFLKQYPNSSHWSRMYNQYLLMSISNSQLSILNTKKMTDNKQRDKIADMSSYLISRDNYSHKINIQLRMYDMWHMGMCITYIHHIKLLCCCCPLCRIHTYLRIHMQRH